jgi:hypothetical protein
MIQSLIGENGHVEGGVEVRAGSAALSAIGSNRRDRRARVSNFTSRTEHGPRGQIDAPRDEAIFADQGIMSVPLVVDGSIPIAK